MWAAVVADRGLGSLVLAHVHIQPSSTVFCCTSSRLHRVQQAALTSSADLSRPEQDKARRGTSRHATRSTRLNLNLNLNLNLHPRIAATTTDVAAHKPTYPARTPSPSPPPFLLSDRPYLDSTARPLALLPSRHPVQYSRAPARASNFRLPTAEPHPLPNSRSPSCLQSHALHRPPSRLRHSLRLQEPRPADFPSL